MRYQPVWQDGVEHGAAQRDCDTRYRFIAHDLQMTWGAPPGLQVIDFGCWGPYFGLRLAEDFGADVTAVDDTRELCEDYRVPKRGTLRIVPTRLTPGQVYDLGDFHVGLCLSVLHHQRNWRDYLDALWLRCQTLYVEVTHPREELPEAVAQDQAADIYLAVRALGRLVCVTPGYDMGYGRTLWALNRTL